MTKAKKNLQKSEEKVFGVFEFITEVFGWLQIVAAPLFIGLAIGAYIYFANPTTLRLIIGITITAVGLIVGIIWATIEWKGKGTIWFMSRIMATPELDDKEQMEWIGLKDKIYHWDGSWRDVCVLQANSVDWKKWVEYVNANYRVDWYNAKDDRDENQIDFNIIEEYWAGNHDLCSSAKVFIDRIQINAHFFDDAEIENDIDPREFNSIEDHNKLVKYMSDLSILLDKEVILTPESEHETVLFRVNKDTIVFNEHIDPRDWNIRAR